MGIRAFVMTVMAALNGTLSTVAPVLLLSTLVAGCGGGGGGGGGVAGSGDSGGAPAAGAEDQSAPTLAMGPLSAETPDLIIQGYTLVSTERISRTVYEYTYSAQVHNNGGTGITFIAGLASTDPHITVVEADLSFHNVQPGTIIDSSDTFTLRHDRTAPFSASALAWKVFEVDTAFAATLESKGIPADVAEFFASAKWELISSETRNYHYLQTFPNGATRDLSISFGPTEIYTPTDAEIAAAEATASQVYAPTYAQTTLPDDTVTMNFQYFVPYSAMPEELRNELQTVPFAATVQKFLTSWVSVASAAGGPQTGARITIQDIARKGAEAGIKSLGNRLDTSAGGNILKIASAAGNVASSNTLRGSYNEQLAELDALRECAAKPTNPIAQGDPGYIDRTTSQIDQLISEMRGNVAVRFLGYFTSTLSGFIPGAIIPKAALSLGQTSNDADLEQINNANMDVARQAVTACIYPFKAVLSFEHEETTPDDPCNITSLHLNAFVSFDVGVTSTQPGATYTFAGLQGNSMDYKFAAENCGYPGDYLRSEGMGVVSNMQVMGGPVGANHRANLTVSATSTIHLTDTRRVYDESNDVWILDTLPSSGAVIMPSAVCTVNGIHSLLAASYTGQIETIPLFGVLGLYTKHQCTVTLTPVK